jgi:hypothetical protein
MALGPRIASLENRHPRLLQPHHQEVMLHHELRQPEYNPIQQSGQTMSANGSKKACDGLFVYCARRAILQVAVMIA